MILNWTDIYALPYNPQLRKGQQYWNHAEKLWGWLVEDMRGGDLDPYHHDDRVEAFLNEVKMRVDRYNKAVEMGLFTGKS